ncbi:hypothetical protein Xen7305DRAFT_00053650 [Xenococcus sp. PCC 7305]|uniref:transposase n=1 Tax=Xenococcus sp. PCC 7305 TaxID=102125 RepID=UPI0002AC5864|nr:transposase [Xenococcus sp. PCC 7305]ELS05617.1 hypothetical protein Xen7305DRAFT_00053650 [Xenococcus sp. PCC 7305]
MIPLVGVPKSIAESLEKYRELFPRAKGFETVSRFITGLILSPNKTLEGIHSQQLWEEGKAIKRRAMHHGVFEARWKSEEIMPKHREIIASEHQDRGQEVISLDWTLTHHEKGEKIYGVKKQYDYVEGKMSRYQTVVTASIANREIIDGIEVVVQEPNYEKEEFAYLEMTSQESYEQMEQVKERLLELLYYQKNRLAYRKRTEIAVDIVKQIEAEARFPKANYAFDNGVLNLTLTEVIEQSGKHWVSEIEKNRNINWKGNWTRVDVIEEELKNTSPSSFRHCQVQGRNGKLKSFWAFTKVVRLKKYGKKRLVIAHETEDLSDTPRFLITDALHWDISRIIQTWNYRWSVEVFHEFSKQITGLESSQVRKEEAVKRHFRLSCVAQSMLQRVTCSGQTSEKFKFAKEKPTIGQRMYFLNREALGQLLSLAEGLFAQGKSCQDILEVFMPA